MVLPSTLFLCTGEDSPTGSAFALVLAYWTGLRGRVFILQLHNHPHTLRLIREHVTHFSCRPLVNFLFLFGANIIGLPNSTNIANDHGLHALLIQHGNKSFCLLMFDILDLVLQFPQLSLLGGYQFLSSMGSFLFLSDLLTEFLLQFVLILPLSSQISTVEDMGILAVVRYGNMNLAQVDASNFPTHRLALCFILAIGSDCFILRARPVNNHCLGLLPLPCHDEWIVSAAIRKSQFTILELDSITLILHTKLPSSPPC